MFDLNESAAHFAALLKEGAGFTPLVSVLAQQGMEAGTAAAMVAELLREWSAAGIIGAAFAPFPPAYRQAIEMSGICADLNYAAPSLAVNISPAFEHLAGHHSSPATLCMNIAETEGLILIGCNGQDAAVVAADEAAPLVKALLVEHILERAPPSLALHAACLLRGGGAMLLSGPPGAGKSSLAIALMTRGHACTGDDITLLNRDGRVQGVPLAASAKSGAWPLLIPFAGDLGRNAVHRRLDDVLVRYLPLVAAPFAQWHDAGWLIRLHRTEGRCPELVRREAPQALAYLMEDAHSAAGPAKIEDMRTLIGVAERVRCYDLHYCDLEGAIGALESLDASR